METTASMERQRRRRCAEGVWRGERGQKINRPAEGGRGDLAVEESSPRSNRNLPQTSAAGTNLQAKECGLQQRERCKTGRPTTTSSGC
ncbi:hypothetical protein COCOBI_14-2220 [Coccomyxa sp. Obi]|nr:hypothetical protein COCOBI_14-2220 [Coccomyxa sp. Obi]